MYFSKKLKIIFIIIVLISSGIKQSNALENKILFKIDNEIITTIDIYEEIKFLKVFNPEINNLDETKLYEISKNSILRDKIKKIEIMNFMDELKVNDKFILNLINNKYPKIKVESLENFEIYLKNNNLNSENIREKFTIELIWNDMVYQKFNKKIIIDKEKIKNEILQSAKKDKQREVLLSEIIFNVNKKNEFTDKYEKILLDIEKIGFKKTALIHSNSDTASNGGLIGWIKEDNLNQNIKEIISKLQPGQFTKPIRTTSGYMLIKIEEDREYLSNLNLDDKINEVIKFKMNNQLNQFSNMYFNKLKKNSTIYGL
tara:strand:+ start:52 stop:996 length:945 start_codon:yes stop_codon:yes gene_type:complete